MRPRAARYARQAERGVVSCHFSRLRSGGLADHPLAFQTRCTTAEVRVPEGTPFNVDGEVVAAGSARFTAQERAFQLVVR